MLRRRAFSPAPNCRRCAGDAHKVRIHRVGRGRQRSKGVTKTPDFRPKTSVASGCVKACTRETATPTISRQASAAPSRE
jgi:hypothetical protein